MRAAEQEFSMFTLEGNGIPLKGKNDHFCFSFPRSFVIKMKCDSVLLLYRGQTFTVVFVFYK